MPRKAAPCIARSDITQGLFARAKELGLKECWLAEEMKVTPQSMKRWRRDVTKMPLPIAEKMAVAMGGRLEFVRYTRCTQSSQSS